MSHGWDEAADNAPICRTRQSERLLLVLLAGVPVSAANLTELGHVRRGPVRVFLRRLEWHGWVAGSAAGYLLTPTGRARALDILQLRDTRP
jgi:DNA-binding GntR family transcriptional regulator